MLIKILLNSISTLFFISPTELFLFARILLILVRTKEKSDKLGRRRKSLYTPFYHQSYLEVSYHQIFHDIIPKPSGSLYFRRSLNVFQHTQKKKLNFVFRSHISIFEWVIRKMHNSEKWTCHQFFFARCSYFLNKYEHKIFMFVDMRGQNFLQIFQNYFGSKIFQCVWKNISHIEIVLTSVLN